MAGASDRPCEVCAALTLAGRAAPAADSGKLRRVRVEQRIVALCPTHASRLTPETLRSLEKLRSVFSEVQGRRSWVARRSPLDRRMFPPRPEGRRRGGRRAPD